MTWDEIKKRSVHTRGKLEMFCFDCHMHFEMWEMPCEKHCQNQNERDELARKFSESIRGLSYSTRPLLKLIKRDP